jgi:protoheme IX farnesyltransferase
MFITGEGLPSLALVCWTMLGGYLAAGGAGAINCAFDKDIDINMGRTSRRPVPSNRISPRNAFVFGLVLSVLAFVILFVFTTPLAALLAVVGIVYYAVFYTRWLKPNTWQNIVIGGAAGALPPLVGWAAVTGSLSLPAVILFLIIFYWTPPHFWALALVKEKDYARAGVPMLPVVAGEAETRWQIWLYSLLMVVLTLLLTPLQAMGLLYLLLALVLGVIFMRYAWNVWRAGGQGNTWALYKYSLLYLALLFSSMVLDRMLLA